MHGVTATSDSQDGEEGKFIIIIHIYYVFVAESENSVNEENCSLGSPVRAICEIDFGIEDIYCRGVILHTLHTLEGDHCGICTQVVTVLIHAVRERGGGERI